MTVEVQCPYCSAKREESEYGFLDALKSFFFKSEPLQVMGPPKGYAGIGSVSLDALVKRTCSQCGNTYWYDKKTYKASKE